MNLITKPYNWISAHRDAVFTFEYEHQYSLTSVADDGGNAVFLFVGDGINSLEVGDYFFINSGVYKGYHKVTEVFTALSNLYGTETAYISNQEMGLLIFVEDAVFDIVAGYTTGDSAVLSLLLPYGDIATFKPEPNSEGQLVVNISGYINKIFDVINSNDTTTIGALTVYYNLFNQIQVWVDDVFVSQHIAINSAIDMYELNRDYVGTNRDLNGGSLGNHYLSCGDSNAIVISGSYVVKGREYENAVIVPLGADFSSVDFAPSDFDITA